MTSIAPVDKPPVFLEGQAAEQVSLDQVLPKPLWGLVLEYVFFSDIVKTKVGHLRRGLPFNGVSYNVCRYPSFKAFEYSFDLVPKSIVFSRNLALVVFNDKEGFDYLIKRSLNLPIVRFFSASDKEPWPKIRLIDYIFCVVKNKDFRSDFEERGKAQQAYNDIVKLGFDADKALVDAFNQKKALTKEDIDKFLASTPTEDDSEKSKGGSQLGLLPSSET